MTSVVLAYVYVYHLLKKHDHLLVFGGVRGVGSNTAHSCSGSVGIAGCMYVDILCLSVRRHGYNSWHSLSCTRGRVDLPASSY